MPYGRRKLMFWTLFIFFVVILPFVIFYTSGYRLSITQDGERVITQTGGFFVGVFNEDVELQVAGTVPSDRRPFSSAYYVQGYEPGMYEVLTQGEGYETWVKELPVTEQIVTQAFAFNVPRVPQVRLIAATTTESGVALLASTSARTTILTRASTSNAVVFATTTPLNGLQNPEYEQLSQQFASVTAKRALLAEIVTQRAQIDEPFQFDSERQQRTIPTTSATSTIYGSDRLLYQNEEGDVYVRYTGDARSIPHYFCAELSAPASTSAQYGAHVYAALVSTFASTTGEFDAALVGSRLCREEIRIDRKWQSVQWFDFVPGSADLVLMHLEDGLYIVEADDRGWQNVQMLYPGEELTVLIDAGRIFVRDGELFLEVFTDLI